jgi:hypothetical protein
MAWQWYFPPTPPDDATIVRTIELFKGTNDLYAQIYFPLAATKYLDRIKAMVRDGDLAISYRERDGSDGLGNGDDALWCHKSRSLSLDPAMGGPVWNISHGLEEINFSKDPNRNVDEAYCVQYIQKRLTQALKTTFMPRMNLTCFYSIDVSQLDFSAPDPAKDRPIRRLQAWGYRNQAQIGWVVTSLGECAGTKPWHKYWGNFYEGMWHFWLTRIS